MPSWKSFADLRSASLSACLGFCGSSSTIPWTPLPVAVPFVPIKTEEQLDLQALHRVRERWVMRRTAVVNDRWEGVGGMIRSMKKLIKIFSAALLSAGVTATVTGSPVYAARMGSASASIPETSSDFPDLRLSDPHKDLRQLSKDLKLTRDQRQVIGSILEERTRRDAASS